MKRAFIINIFLFTFLATRGQTNQSPTLIRWIKNFNLHPLNWFDNISKDLSKNSITKSGWHIDYYAGLVQNDGENLNVYTFIYNDSVFHSSSYPVGLGRFNFKRDNYTDTLIKETSDFLYFTNINSDLGDNISIFSKKDDRISFWFQDLIAKDLEKDIYINDSRRYCQEGKIPYLMATNINTNKSTEIKFNGYCDNNKNWCIETVLYLDGVLTITANVTNKKRNKLYKETKRIKI